MGDCERLQLCVGYQKQYLPVSLTLGHHEAGDALTLGHLCRELQRQTGIPAQCMSFVVKGKYNGLLWCPNNCEKTKY